MDEIEKIRDLAKTKTLEEICGILGIGIGQLRWLLKKHKIVKYILNKSDPAMDRRLHDYAEKYGGRVAAIKFKVTIHEVKSACRRIRKKRKLATEFFSDRARYKQYIGWCKTYARSHGSEKDPDDFASWAILNIFEGGRINARTGMVIPKIEHLHTQYLIDKYGRRGSQDNESRLAEDTWAEVDDHSIISNDHETNAGVEWFLVCDKLEIKGTERIVFLLRYREGLNLNEIAKYFGITESRVSQILSALESGIGAERMRASIEG